MSNVEPPAEPFVPAPAQPGASMATYKRELRKEIRRNAGEQEINFLNITAMMDMMTIILVFLIKSYATSSLTMTSSEELKPPISSTRLTPKDTIAITITRRNVLVGDKVKVTLTLGRKVNRIEIDPEFLKSEGMELALDSACAAINTALAQAEKDMEAELAKVTGGAKIPGLI